MTTQTAAAAVIDGGGKTLEQLLMVLPWRLVWQRRPELRLERMHGGRSASSIEASNHIFRPCAANRRAFEGYSRQAAHCFAFLLFSCLPRFLFRFFFLFFYFYFKTFTKKNVHFISFGFSFEYGLCFKKFFILYYKNVQYVIYKCSSCIIKMFILYYENVRRVFEKCSSRIIKCSICF